ncbi:MAG: hypothetical protein ABIH82_03680 [Candidatus Woesearchaeota archaeon]
MRESHQEQIERWANFVRNNPTKWKKIHTQFIDSIFAKHKDFLERLRTTPGGDEKIKKLYKRN